ncbi:hypothetical protein MTO96_028701, partial [Rhipicephalus appendiculatus]
MASTKTSKRKPPGKQYAGLVEDFKRQAHIRTIDKMQANKRPKMSEQLGDKGSTKMNVLKKEQAAGTAATATAVLQQPISAATGAGQALATQWQKEVGTARQAGQAQLEHALSPSGPSETTPTKQQTSGLLQRNRTATLEACAVVVTIVFVMAVAGVFVGAAIVRKWKATCRTEGCHMFSEALVASMDTSANPCEDFSQYVCGRYSHPRNMSVAQAALSNFRLELASTSRNESLIATGQSELQKTMRFFKSCVDVVETAGVDNTRTVLDGLRDAGIGWPSPQGASASTLVEAMVLFTEYMGWPSLLDFSIENKAQEPSQVTVLPSRLTKAMVSRGSWLKSSKSFSSFFDLVVSNYKRVAVKIPNASATFEEVMSAEQRRTSLSDYEALPGAEVTFSNNTEPTILKATEALKRALSKLPWQTLRLADLSFSTQYWTLVHKVLTGIVEAPRDFELIMAWHVVHYVAPITNRELAVAYHDFSELPLDTIHKHRRFCFRNMLQFYGVATFSMYVKEHFTKPVREQVEAVAKDIRRLYFTTLTDTTYDWASLSGPLKYLTRAQSVPRQGVSAIAQLRTADEILDGVGDIGFDIVANYRTLTVAYTKAGDDMAWLLGSELGVDWQLPFTISANNTPMLPWALSFPFYRNDVPAYLRYGAFATSFARPTALVYAMHKSKTVKEYAACCLRSFRPSPNASVVVHSWLYSSAFDAAVNLYQGARANK